MMFLGEEPDWDDIEPVAKNLFDVWNGGGELQWAKEAWGHLINAGLVDTSNIIELTRSQLRLLTLAFMYDQFCRHAWQESSVEQPSDLSEDMEFDRFALGVLYGMLDPASDAFDKDELAEEAINEVCVSLRSEIVSCLLSSYGGKSDLYARLWSTRNAADDDDGEDADVFEPDADQLAGYDFVDQGFNW